jgi:hypothetical protein
MRAAMVAVVLALVMAGGCGVEQARVDKQEKEDKISAARLGGKFRYDDPLVQMLSPEERGALGKAGMMAEVPEGEELADADGATPSDEKEQTGMEQAGGVMLSVLSVVVPLGMAVAPYLLF